MYQIYNGGYWVVREMKYIKKKFNLEELPCHHDCVKIGCDFCKQLGFRKCRSKQSCKINYFYSKKIYELGLKYKKGKENKQPKTYKYW